MYQVGYWTELDSIKLDDGETMVSTFQAMPYGEYEHPVYGKIKFDQTVAAQAAENVNSKVRGTDLDIDYDHKQYGGEAAGWLQSAEARTDGLYLTVEWTKKAWEAIKNKAYRYFSPEFADEWTHPKTKVVHKNVLFGGGITNRPFLKDILPLNMSELFAEQQGKEETGMDPKELRKLLGLAEDATEEQVRTALQERNSDNGGGADGGDNPPVKDKVDPPEGQPQHIAANEGLPAEVIKLAEESPAIKSLVDMVTALQTTVSTQSVALKLAETAGTVKKLSEPVQGKALPPAAQTKLQEALIDAPKELSDKIVEFVETLNKTGYVQLTEHGETRQHDGGGNDDPTKKFNEAVEKIMSDNKELTYGDAVERAASQQPDLFESYRQGSYAFREQ